METVDAGDVPRQGSWPPARWDRIALGAIAFGALLRLLWILVIHPPYEYIVSDMQGYVERAMKLASGGELVRYDAFYSPGTHMVLAVPFATFGNGPPGLPGLAHRGRAGAVSGGRPREPRGARDGPPHPSPGSGSPGRSSRRSTSRPSGGLSPAPNDGSFPRTAAPLALDLRPPGTAWYGDLSRQATSEAAGPSLSVEWPRWST